MYSRALDLYQTLPNYTGQRGIICYSFVCLADKIGQLLRTNHPDCTPASAKMHSRALRNTVPVMSEESEWYQNERKDILKALRGHADLRTKVRGQPSPISLKVCVHWCFRVNYTRLCTHLILWRYRVSPVAHGKICRVPTVGQR